MRYTEAQYIRHKTTNEIVAIQCTIDGAVSTVPIDPDNCDYQQIMLLADKGELIVADPSLISSNNNITT
jgi:hypothetical protein